MAEAVETDFVLVVYVETERGLPGPPGPPAAPAVASASRSVSAPAATRPLVMVDECVWAKTVRRGMANKHTHSHTPT